MCKDATEKKQNDKAGDSELFLLGNLTEKEKLLNF